MGPLIDASWLIAVVLGFGFINLAFLIYFAKKPRSARTKILSLVIPTVIAILASVASYSLFGSGLDVLTGLIIPLAALVLWSVSVVTVLIVPHFLSSFIPQQKWLYGIWAVLLFSTPIPSLVKNVLEYQRNSRELARIKLAAEPVLAQCCAGNAASCHEMTFVFSKAFNLERSRSLDTDLRNKYYAVACRAGSAFDCKQFEYASGRKMGDPEGLPIYEEACSVQDLYRLEERRYDEFGD